ncbi:hypothetical protein ACOME3_004911 [Neoechinorhynchus agilis]
MYFTSIFLVLHFIDQLNSLPAEVIAEIPQNSDFSLLPAKSIRATLNDTDLVMDKPNRIIVIQMTGTPIDGELDIPSLSRMPFEHPSDTFSRILNMVKEMLGNALTKNDIISEPVEAEFSSSKEASEILKLSETSDQQDLPMSKSSDQIILTDEEIHEPEMHFRSYRLPMILDRIRPEEYWEDQYPQRQLVYLLPVDEEMPVYCCPSHQYFYW